MIVLRVMLLALLLMIAYLLYINHSNRFAYDGPIIDIENYDRISVSLVNAASNPEPLLIYKMDP